MIIPVILSGGSGSRLWPVSRELVPKQLLRLVGQTTMLQETILRLQGISDISAPLIVCNDAHRFMVADQLCEISCNPLNILLEPCGRNTAPAVAIAAMTALVSSDDPLLLILPSDHLIVDVDAFQRTCLDAIPYARSGKLVTFGVVPQAPETGYGYIQQGQQIERNKGVAPAFNVERFVEKPDLELAKKYLASETFLWNSGIFLISAKKYLDELRKFAPEVFDSCEKAHAKSVQDLDFLRIEVDTFALCPNISIDYAVMEKTAAAAVIPLDAGWNDVGSWSAFWDIAARDAEGNSQKGDVMLHQTRNCLVLSDSRLVATVGINNCIVVETPDAVLVADKDHVQDVKEIVTRLKQEKRQEAINHRTVYRPWGSYQSIDASDRFQVKRITVNVGASISLQKHHHRAEHWVVVKGTAKVYKGDQVLTVSENESTYIPLGVVHRLENPGLIPLELIEVQSGSYLGEDDIVRLEDVYGRK